MHLLAAKDFILILNITQISSKVQAKFMGASRGLKASFGFVQIIDKLIILLIGHQRAAYILTQSEPNTYFILSPKRGNDRSMFVSSKEH